MNTKIVGWVAILLVIIGIGAFWRSSGTAPAVSSNDESTSTATTLAQTGTAKKAYAWKLTSAGEASGMPQTGVSLMVGAAEQKLGTFEGNCSEIDGTSWKLLDGEKMGVICWWAGGGKEIGIFQEGGVDVVKVGDLDEGSAETPGVRGNFKTVFTLGK